MAILPRQDKTELEKFLSLSGLILLTLGFIYWLTSLWMAIGSSRLLYQELPLTGGIVGPFEIKKPAATCVLEIYKDFRSSMENAWNWIGIELLDAKKKYLFSFGDELWNERGIDGEGYSWHESKKRFKMKFVISEPGSYYLRMRTESSGSNSQDFILLDLRQAKGSSMLFFWVGLVLMLAGGGLIFYSYRDRIK